MPEIQGSFAEQKIKAKCDTMFKEKIVKRSYLYYNYLVDLVEMEPVVCLQLPEMQRL